MINRTTSRTSLSDHNGIPNHASFSSVSFRRTSAPSASIDTVHSARLQRWCRSLPGSAAQARSISDITVAAGGQSIGGRGLVVMAGPCSVENREQLIQTAQSVSKAGATILRGGAFKPRLARSNITGHSTRPGWQWPHVAVVSSTTVTRLLDCLHKLHRFIPNRGAVSGYPPELCDQLGAAAAYPLCARIQSAYKAGLASVGGTAAPPKEEGRESAAGLTGHGWSELSSIPHLWVMLSP